MGLRAIDKRRELSRRPLESGAKGRDSRVGEGENSEMVPEYRGTREILWEAGGTTPQA